LWTAGSENLSLDFTSVPEYYVLDEKLIICEYLIMNENDTLSYIRMRSISDGRILNNLYHLSK